MKKVLAKSSEIKEGQLHGFQAGDHDILVTRLEGKFYSIGNICTHEQCTLSEGELSEPQATASGELTGAIVTCPCHLAQFDIKTGQVLRGPNFTEPQTIKPEPSFKVWEEAGKLFVEIPQTKP